MKPINFEKIIFPVNAVITAVVFFLLAPSTYIYAQWFPDKKNILWLIPAGAVLISVLLWLLTSLNMPRLIDKGVFEDRRKNSRSSELPEPMDVRRTVWPVITFLFHMILLIGISAGLIAGMKRETPGPLFTNISGAS